MSLKSCIVNLKCLLILLLSRSYGNVIYEKTIIIIIWEALILEPREQFAYPKSLLIALQGGAVLVMEHA